MSISETTRKFNVHQRAIGQIVDSRDTIDLMERKKLPEKSDVCLKPDILKLSAVLQSSLSLCGLNVSPSRYTSFRNML